MKFIKQLLFFFLVFTGLISFFSCNPLVSNPSIGSNFNPGFDGSSGSSCSYHGELDPSWAPEWSNIIGYWKLDDAAGSPTVIDSSGNGNTGTINGGVTLGVPGKIDTAASFDGSTGYIALPSGMANFTTGITIAVWAYPTSSGSWARFTDFSNGAGSDNIIFARDATSSNLNYSVYLGGADSTNVIATGVIVNNTWQYYVVTEDSLGNVVLYVNGSEVASGSGAVPNNLTRTQNNIGLSAFAGCCGDAYYAGTMDDVAVWNTALTAAQIQTIYSRQSTDDTCD